MSEAGARSVLEVASARGYEMTKTGIVFNRLLSDAEYDMLGLKHVVRQATTLATRYWSFLVLVVVQRADMKEKLENILETAVLLCVIWGVLWMIFGGPSR